MQKWKKGTRGDTAKWGLDVWNKWDEKEIKNEWAL